MEKYAIENQWDLWFHSIKNTKWDKSSYKKIYTIKNYLDFGVLDNIFKQNHYQNGMFFVMKSGIFPNWEDPENRLGGCLSFKVKSSNVIECWNDILFKCISGKSMRDLNDKINGLSISPKKEFNIIKLWFSEKDVNYKDNFIEFSDLNINNSLYKAHSVD